MTNRSRIRLFIDQERKWGFPKTFRVGTKIVKSYFFDVPKTIIVEPTSVCNLNCTFCAPSKINLGRKSKFLNYKIFRKMIDDIKKDCWSILFTFCGEPFLNKDIYLMIRYANENGIFTSASSNMTVFKNLKIINNLIDSGLNHLTVSIDGITKKTYELHRVGGNFDLVVGNIRKVVNQKIKKKSITPFLDLQMVVTRQNIDEFAKFSDFAKKVGADGAYLKPLYIDKGMSEDYVKRLEKDLFIERAVTRYLKEGGETKIKKQTPCDFLDKLVISCDGDVFVCCMDYLGKYQFGNIGKENLLDIWRKKKYEKFREEIMKAKKLDICHECVTAISKTLYSK